MCDFRILARCVGQGATVLMFRDRLCNVRGLMVDRLGNISRAFACPNALACPGGVISDVEGEQNRTMCREGPLHPFLKPAK